jgi:asparagine synthetase B (glutamine-hydrolysing)
MCGIFVSVFGGENAGLGNLADKLRAANSDRGLWPSSLLCIRLNCGGKGPDAKSICRSSVDSATCTLSVEFFASELRLRGHASTVQPHQYGGNVLCWNGEVIFYPPIQWNTTPNY